MKRRDFLAAFPGLLLIARGMMPAPSPWKDDRLMIVWPAGPLPPNWFTLLAECHFSVNANTFAGQQPGTVRLDEFRVSAPDSLRRRTVTLTFRRGINSTIAGHPIYRYTDFSRLT